MSELNKNQASRPNKVEMGVIKGVLKADDYETTHERLFEVVSKEKKFYMPASEAPKALAAKKKLSEIVGNEVRFIVTEVKGDKTYCSYRKIYEDYTRDIEEKTVMHGTVLGVRPDRNDYRNTCLIISRGNEIFHMNQADVDLIPPGHAIYSYVGHAINFVIIRIDEENDMVFVSHKVLREPVRDKVIEEMKTEEVMDAAVIRLFAWGARLMCKGIPVIMRNKDFSTDYTRVDAVYKVGDTVRVKLVEVSPSKRIFVCPEEKYTTPANTNFNLLKPEMIVKGKVSSVTSFGIFVNIMPGIDALCGMPREIREPARDEMVTIRIQKLFPENHRVRGVITGFVKDDIPEVEEEV